MISNLWSYFMLLEAKRVCVVPFAVLLLLYDLHENYSRSYENGYCMSVLTGITGEMFFCMRNSHVSVSIWSFFYFHFFLLNIFLTI